VLFFYTAELDALMHRVGISDASVGERLRRYEGFVARVADAASASGRPVEIHVFSDHGMTPVTHAVDVRAGLEQRGFTLGNDYLAFFDSTMVRIWGEEPVAEAAEAAFGGHGRLLSDEDLRAFGCLFPDREYGDWILLADPGVMVVPSFMGRAVIAGMHGYDPRDRYSPGIFFTSHSGPDLPNSIGDVKNWLVRAIGGGRR